MQFDGIMMRACIVRINQELIGARLQRVLQISPLSVSLALYAGAARHIVCSAEAEAACVFVADATPQRQEQPGSFASVLRRNLTGARLVAARQTGWDRVACLTFRAHTELGDAVLLDLWIETMGKHSNLILVRPDDKIVDAIKRVGRSRSRIRQVLPGLQYVAPPPGPAKLSPAEVTAANLRDALGVGLGAAGPTPSALVAGQGRGVTAADVVRAVAGVGPDRANRLLASGGGLGSVQTTIAASLAELAARVESGDPDVAREAEPLFWQALAAGEHSDGQRAASEATGKREQPWSFAASPRQRQVHAAATRVAARLAEELAATQAKLTALPDPELLRIEADSIMSSLPAVREALTAAAVAGQAEVRLTLPSYEPTGDDGRPTRPPVTTALDSDADPIAQAQERYAAYTAASRRMSALREHAAAVDARLAALALLTFQLEGDLTPDELSEVAAEAALLGVVDASAGPAQGRGATAAGRGRRQTEGRMAASEPRRAISPGGYDILVGRNNQQNDSIVKRGREGDLWFHARGVPGAHVLLRGAGRALPFPDEDIRFAAALAAAHSQARNATSVAVDYCPARNLRRERGAAPGFVTYSGEHTVHVTPAARPIQEA